MEDYGLNNHIQEVHLKQDVLKLIIESLPLEGGNEVISLAKSRMESLTHAKERPNKLDPQIGVGLHNLNLFPLEVEI
jgi:hypothetical protein